MSKHQTRWAWRTTLFKLDHMLKDVRLCLEAAGVPFPFAEQVAATLTEASRAGYGDADFAALITALEREAGIRLE